MSEDTDSLNDGHNTITGKKRPLVDDAPEPEPPSVVSPDIPPSSLTNSETSVVNSGGGSFFSLLSAVDMLIKTETEDESSIVGSSHGGKVSLGPNSFLVNNAMGGTSNNSTASTAVNKQPKVKKMRLSAPDGKARSSGKTGNSAHTTSIDPFHHYVKQLHDNDAVRPLLRFPIVGGKLLNLKKLLFKVSAVGGSDTATLKNKWRSIALSLDLPLSCTNAGHLLRKYHTLYIQPYHAQLLKFAQDNAESLDKEDYEDLEKMRNYSHGASTGSSSGATGRSRSSSKRLNNEGSFGSPMLQGEERRDSFVMSEMTTDKDEGESENTKEQDQEQDLDGLEGEGLEQEGEGSEPAAADNSPTEDRERERDREGRDAVNGDGLDDEEGLEGGGAEGTPPIMIP